MAPFAHFTPPTRERLTQTLYAWLRSQGRIVDASRLLHLHPQTVRYRSRRSIPTFRSSPWCSPNVVVGSSAGREGVATCSPNRRAISPARSVSGNHCPEGWMGRLSTEA
ncbi:PucR family transcriptional regulator [Actinomadura opuntiae]|uniref:PucR family transcriptional regulator n=1 Tax=Actinomadura sp. OS1-43 TaxID=604315 RepID=UPI00334036E7